MFANIARAIALAAYQVAMYREATSPNLRQFHTSEIATWEAWYSWELAHNPVTDALIGVADALENAAVRAYAR